MTPTVENPACRPEEQGREQESQNGSSSQDGKESQNYDGDGEQENDKDWSASDALQNPAKPHPLTPAESATTKKSGCPPTGEPHQTQQRENWHKPKEKPTSLAYLPQKNMQEDGRD